MKTINKFILITLSVVLLPIFLFSQTKKELPKLDSIPQFAVDTNLNKFITHWIGKPYRLGGKTERGIDCSQFNKRLATDVYKIELQNTCSTQWENTNRIKKDSLEIGDLIFFRSRISPSGWH